MCVCLIAVKTPDPPRGATVSKRFFFIPPIFLLLSFTFEPDHQRHLQLQLSARLGDAVGDDGAVDDAAEDVDQDGLDLRGAEDKQIRN